MAADKKKLDFSQAGIKGIMNPKSRSVKKRRVELIDYDDIVANPENKYSISDVEDLAESIAAVGLRQPLELSLQDDGKYKLLAGERRWTAIGMLREQGRFDRFEAGVDSFIVEAEEIDLPLSDDMKELFLLYTTNSEQRDKTDYDLMQEAAGLDRIYAELKKKGYKIGQRRRARVAEQMGVSERQVHRLTTMEKNLTPEAKEAFKEEVMPLTVAESLAELEPDEQRKFLQDKKGKPNIQQKDVDEYKERKAQNIPASVAVKPVVFKPIESKVRVIKSLLGNKITVSDAQNKKINQQLAAVENSLEAIFKIISNAQDEG